MRLEVAVVCGVLAWAGCERPTQEVATAPETTPVPELTDEAPKPADEGALQGFATPANQLGFELYAQARERAQGENLGLSPASISLAFDMLYAGARGETATQMQQVMHIEDAGQAIHDSASSALAHFNDEARTDYQLRVVNRLFGDEAASFEADYVALTRSKYAAPIEAIDFRGAPEPSRAHINGWVGEQTEQRITDLLPLGAVTANTRLVLVNAIYFLGSWATRFDPKMTSDAAFNLDSGQAVQVPTMHRTGSMRYGTAPGVSLVELPYQGEALAMTLIVPEAAGGLAQVEEGFDLDTLEQWTAALHEQELALSLPRFEIHTRSTLSRELSKLGMAQVFTKEADFTGIANPPDVADRIFVSEAYHQVFVAVDERGTEAAAATAVAMGPGSVAAPIATLDVDRPFLFVIRERGSGAILFMGRVLDPR